MAHDEKTNPQEEKFNKRLERLVERGQKPGPLEHLIYFLTWSLGKIFFHLYFRMSITGSENVPKSGPVILASNHTSHLDPPILAFICFRRIYFLAKSELFKNAFFGWYINSLGAFPIKRGAGDRAALKASSTILKNNNALVMFPEGTRSPDGEPQDPKSGLGMLLNLVPEAQIVPVHIEGGFQAFGAGRKFPKPTKIRVSIRKPFRLEDLNDLPSVKKQLYHELGKETMSRIFNSNADSEN